jgi:hypothetical protein
MSAQQTGGVNATSESLKKAVKASNKSGPDQPSESPRARETSRFWLWDQFADLINGTLGRHSERAGRKLGRPFVSGPRVNLITLSDFKDLNRVGTRI